MAALRSLALASPISHCWHPQSRSPSLSGIVTWAVHGSAQSPFNGQSVHMPRMRLSPVTRNSKVSGPITMAVKPTIQFIQGTDELTVPDVKLTKSRDGSNGMAIFSFSEPSVFDSSGEIGDITGFYMIDEEGTLQSVDVSAKFVNGRPSRIEAKYIMRSPREWDRFMRFMERQMVKALLDSHLSLMQKPYALFSSTYFCCCY
ncbi:hypothetical protein CICLE_v10022322mg [Citrus x clementina]|uniref:Photosystem II reaction center Psb28 protein n=3 Tax=Citrus TaxID=2706 RepID=A0ACB8MIA4_CITSI|nr:hypothetical protein CICLE_v10022322mg [Citrus x clementina]KAH9785150.1 photosystem II reaction center Psb28 protein [Citrus sinensis]KDO60344.1 hypothetical protein CISIN_1g028962mg [Citrus sinensis]